MFVCRTLLEISLSSLRVVFHSFTPKYLYVPSSCKTCIDSTDVNVVAFSFCEFVAFESGFDTFVKAELHSEVVTKGFNDGVSAFLLVVVLRVGFQIVYVEQIVDVRVTGLVSIVIAV